MSWREKRPHDSILEKIGEAPGLLPQVAKDKPSYLGLTCREGGCPIVKAAVLGLKGGKRSRGPLRLHYTDNVKEWLGMELKQAACTARDRKRW